jgi:hypothetical protein
MSKYLQIYLFAVILFFSHFLFAGIIQVPADTSSIQGGIYLARDGDTVLVAEGRYRENINFIGKAITVASYFIMDDDTNHISNTVINGGFASNPDSGSVVYLITGEDTTSVLKGFTITGGTGTKYTYGSRNQHTGGGILLWSGGIIENNKIIYNHLTTIGNRYTHGAGLEAFPEENAIIRNNLIAHNSIDAWWGGGAGALIGCADTTSLVFENNKLMDNVYQADGGHSVGGIYCAGGANWQGKILLKNNMIVGNLGVSIGAFKSLGGGIYIENSSPILINNIISYNYTNGDGGAIHVNRTNSTTVPVKPIFINNTITNNSADEYGGGIILFRCPDTAFIMNSILWDNSAGLAGDEIYIKSGRIKLVASVVADYPPDINQGIYNLNPVFSDPMGHLSPQSGIIGLGRNCCSFKGEIFNAPITDIEGNPRPCQEDSLIDPGAFESNLPCKPHPDTYSRLPLAPFIHPVNDTMILNSYILNPHLEDLQVFGYISNHNGVITTSTELFDDGNHYDGEVDDGLYGGVLRRLPEDYFTSAAVAIENINTGESFVFGTPELFTTVGPLKLDSIIIYDGYPAGPFYRIPFKIVIRNNGVVASARNVRVYASSLDPLVAGLDHASQSFGDIAAGLSVICPDSMMLRLRNPGSIENIDLHISFFSDNVLYWQDSTDMVVSLKGVERGKTLPTEFSLYQNYPNPFNPTTIITFDLPQASKVTLKIFNPLGEELATLVSDDLPSGSYEYKWSRPAGLASGIYLYRLQTEEFVETRKMVLMK